MAGKYYSVAASLVLAAIASSVLAEGTLYYDAPSGEVFFDLDIPEDRFITFDIASSSGLLKPEEYVRLGGPTILLSTSETYIADNAGFGTFKPEGFYELGAIYPPNVSQEAFVADVVSTWGAETVLELFPFDIEFGRPVGVPLNSGSLPTADEAWAEAATLLYDRRTGELTLDSVGAEGGYISAIVLESPLFESNEFQLDVRVDDFLVQRLDQGVFVAGLLPTGVYDLGAVLPAGLGLDEVETSFTDAFFVPRAGVGIRDFDFDPSTHRAFQFASVPEPSGHLLAIWLLSFALCCRRTKRKSPVR